MVLLKETQILQTKLLKFMTSSYKASDVHKLKSWKVQLSQNISHPFRVAKQFLVFLLPIHNLREQKNKHRLIFLKNHMLLQVVFALSAKSKTVCDGSLIMFSRTVILFKHPQSQIKFRNGFAMIKLILCYQRCFL